MTFTRIIATAVAVLIAGAATPAHVSALEKQELKCLKKLPGTALKLASTTLKETSKCLDSDISGKAVGACPNASNDAKILKAQDKLLSDIGKNCTSTCGGSELPCVADIGCPASPFGGREGCNAGAKNNVMDIRALGFPGGLCPAVIGGRLSTQDDVNDCVSSLTGDVTDAFLASVYGSITSASGISAEAGKCLASISKAAQKLGTTALKSVNKCRQNIEKIVSKRVCVGGSNNGGKCTVATESFDCPDGGSCPRPSAIAPTNCLTADPKVVDKVAKAEAKLAKAIDTKCTDTDIQALDLCGNGVAGTPDRATATACVTPIARELFVAASLAYEDRATTTPSLEEVVYPQEGRCGDGVVNVLQGEFNQYAEECDGASDAACPGECLPPGDLFQCSCGNIPRTVYQSDSLLSELDSGWTGNSHDQLVNDKGGYVSTMMNCNCTDMDGATCIGSSTDPICDTPAATAPRCSWDHTPGSPSCDDHGDGDGVATDSDCYVCDAESSNAGSLCTEDEDCGAQCIDAGGTPTGPCTAQGDCAAGEICLGKCDFDATCQFVLLSHPTPLNSSGNPTCLRSEYRDDVTGTNNIFTGEREVFQLVRTRVFLGESVPIPCPVCGGVCVGGGTQDGEICTGTCGISGDDCRFDTDCPGGETCTTASPDCPGGSCDLELKCFGGNRDGLGCRIGSPTLQFGTPSLDCPPNDDSNISGDGLEISFFPATTEPTSLAYTLPCTSVGFELYDCPCPQGSEPGEGFATKPNTCRAACDAGPEVGTGCGIGNTSGQFTLCVGGVNNAKGCDEDLDCPGGTCSGNPTHCVGTGNPATELNTCNTNADCGLGTCQDACPSGRCVPLCQPDPGDPQDGICAAGPVEYKCSGIEDTFRICSAVEEAGGCSATCSIAGTPCFGNADCPGGETCDGPCLKAQLCEAGEDGILGTPDDITGAGVCTTDTRRCFLNPIVSEGGDIFNGEGDPSFANAPATYCTPPTNSLIINAATGLGGPGRLRSKGPVISNGIPSIP